MANNFDSNVTKKVMLKVAEAYESQRNLSKMVNTQMFAGEFNANTGDKVYGKRPTDYTSVRTSDGDITGQNKDIVTGQFQATVQDMITVPVEYGAVDEAINMGTDQNRFWDDIARRLVVDEELDLTAFTMAGAGLSVGTVGTGVTEWGEVAEAGALMSSTGVSKSKKWCYFVNPYSMTSLANQQRGLGVNPEVQTANQEAMIRKNFAGFDVFEATTMSSYTTGTGAGRAGTIASNPDVTYVTAKDTMQQTIAVTAFQANLVIAAGETVTIAGRNRLNLSTRQPVLDASGAPVPFTATVAQTVTLDGSGAGNLVVTGPAIFEATGAYNTVDSAPVAADVVTLGGAANTVIQPNMFWHPDAFGVVSIKMPKLHSTDTIYTSKDGLQIRCSKYSDGAANKQEVRFDIHRAYGVIDPFKAGLGFGTP